MGCTCLYNMSCVRPRSWARRFCAQARHRRVPCAAKHKTFLTGVEDEFSDLDIATVDRQRWSNLSVDAKRLVHRPGSVVGSAALVAGTTIGAGILALPAVTQDAGFFPSCATLLLFYVFSAAAGLMIVEVNINTVCELGGGAVSLQSMVQRTLGRGGAAVSSAAYVFLHYSLLVAYISRGGGALADAAGQPLAPVAAAFVAALGALCFFCSGRVLDAVNTFLLALVIVTFFGLVSLALPGVSAENLAVGDVSAVIPTLPVVALAYVYQNVVPVVVSSLEGDVPRVRTAILAGLAVPLLMFVGWEAAVLGSVNASSQSGDPVEALQAGSAAMGPLVEVFAFLAIVTSFIGFVLGLTDFLQDALPMQSRAARLPAYVLTLVPPYFLAMAFPDIFFAALDTAGTYGVLVLFGVLPAAMAWSERSMGASSATEIRVVPGGRATMLAVGGISAAVIAGRLYDTLAPALAN